MSQHPQRGRDYECRGPSLLLNYAKHALDDEACALLDDIGKAASLQAGFTALVNGHIVNQTEDRPALHTLLRGTAKDQHAQRYAAITATHVRMQQLVNALHSGALTGFTGEPFTDVVNLGIGGSDLGPRLVCQALPSAATSPSVHFVANLDADDLCSVTQSLRPETTLFILCSKSFSTEETLNNGELAKQWLRSAGASEAQLAQHFVAVTANTGKASAWGLHTEQCLPMWEWVGGRYSVWSAVGLSAAIHCGWDEFCAFLQGAQAMDSHTLAEESLRNMPMTMALLEWWQQHAMLAGQNPSHVIVPYSHKLRTLPEFLQQLTMESNGKSTRNDGRPVDYMTAPILWGSAGTTGQHSYFQLLHQGRIPFTADIVLPLHGSNEHPESQKRLVANALAQSYVLMSGRQTEHGDNPEEEVLPPHQVIPGNHSHSVLYFDCVNAFTLGALIAAYEHKTFFLSLLLDINAFDQWGVELGKQVSRDIYHALDETKETDIDAATSHLMAQWRGGDL
jgi:glucose-6-phosphate isomerase